MPGLWWLQRLLPLPDELVELVWAATFPRPYMRCNGCGVIALYIDSRHVLHSQHNFSILNGRLRCNPCSIAIRILG